MDNPSSDYLPPEDTSLLERGEQPAKFVLVGLSGVLVNYLVIFLALQIAGLNDPISLALAIIISMSTNYLLNRIWTFQSHNVIYLEYGRYIISNSLGTVIQYVIALFLEIQFERKGILSVPLLIIHLPTIYIASGIGIGFGFIANFLFSKYFVFN